jgi:hypothetical protein
MTQKTLQGMQKTVFQSTISVMEHHATVFEGDGTVEEMARQYVREVLLVTPEGNPDVSVYVYEQLTVGDARTLKERASQAPLGNKQVFMLMFGRATTQAQNALLKLLEEPGPGTYFVLMVPSVDLLLPTVRSRLAYGGRKVSALTDVEFAKTFIHASTGERLDMLAPILKEKDRTRARCLVDALEHELHGVGAHANAAALKEVVFVRQYLPDTSSSLKMLLEHLALTL